MGGGEPDGLYNVVRFRTGQSSGRRARRRRRRQRCEINWALPAGLTIAAPAAGASPQRPARSKRDPKLVDGRGQLCTGKLRGSSRTHAAGQARHARGRMGRRESSWLPVRPWRRAAHRLGRKGLLVCCECIHPVRESCGPVERLELRSARIGADRRLADNREGIDFLVLREQLYLARVAHIAARIACPHPHLPSATTYRSPPTATPCRCDCRRQRRGARHVGSRCGPWQSPKGAGWRQSWRVASRRRRVTARRRVGSVYTIDERREFPCSGAAPSARPSAHMKGHQRVGYFPRSRLRPPTAKITPGGDLWIVEHRCDVASCLHCGCKIP